MNQGLTPRRVLIRLPSVFHRKNLVSCSSESDYEFVKELTVSASDRSGSVVEQDGLSVAARIVQLLHGLLMLVRCPLCIALEHCRRSHAGRCDETGGCRRELQRRRGGVVQVERWLYVERELGHGWEGEALGTVVPWLVPWLRLRLLSLLLGLQRLQREGILLLQLSVLLCGLGLWLSEIFERLRHQHRM